jgi:prevent-host-death family protein
MARVRPSEDVRPLSEFRANAASFVQQVQGTKRPVILTVHGRSAAVLLDVGEYETLLDRKSSPFPVGGFLDESCPTGWVLVEFTPEFREGGARPCA